MSSLLAQQLQAHRISNPLPPPADSKKSRPTILFRDSDVKANNLDARQVLDIGRNGLQKLTAFNSNLKQYQSTLFSTTLGSDPRSERHLLPKSERESLDKQCRELLAEISPYLHLDAGKEVLEFLLQRYFVHISSLDALLLAVLPYHDTSLFTAVVELPAIPLVNSKWEFLTRIKLDARGITRPKLVAVCSKELALMEEICRHTCKSHPRLFAAIAFECIEKISQDGASASVLEGAIQIAIRNGLDCLKVDRSENILAACMVFSTAVRLISLSIDAAEALLIILARRLEQVKNSDGKDELKVHVDDLARCMIQVYEWQNIGDRSLFIDQTRFDKFEKSVRPVFSELVRGEGSEHASKIVTSLVVRGLTSAHVVESLSDAIKSGPSFSVRADALLIALGDAFKQNPNKETIKHFQLVMEVVGTNHPDAVTAWLAAMEPLQRSKIVKSLFPDTNSALAVRLVPAANELNLPIAVRDSRLEVRLMALRQLKSQSKQADGALSACLDEDLVSVLLENYLDEPTKTNQMTEEFCLVLNLIEKMLNTSDIPSDTFEENACRIARTALADQSCKSNHEASLAAVHVLAARKAKSDEDLLALASVVATPSTLNDVRSAAQKALDKSWLKGVSADAKSSGAALGKALKKELPEVVEPKLMALAKVLPSIAICTIESLIGDFLQQAPEWLLRILETCDSQSLDGLTLSDCKKVASRIVSLLGLDVAIKRLLEVSSASWSIVLPIVVEAMKSQSADEARRIIVNQLIVTNNDGVKDDRRIVRALRLFRGHLASSPSSSSSHKVAAKEKPPASAKKAAASVTSAQSEWIALLPCLKHPRTRQIRSEALNVVEVIGGKAGELFLPRRNEIERDATAVDRAVRGDVQIKLMLAKESESAVAQGNLAVCRAALECTGDATIASKILLAVLDEVAASAKNEELVQLVSMAFNCLIDESSTNVSKETVLTLCNKGLLLFPQPTLKWMQSVLDKIPPTGEMLDLLVESAVGKFLTNDMDASTAADVVERSGLVLTRIAFREKDVLARLVESMNAIRGSSSSASVASTNKKANSKKQAGLLVSSSSISDLPFDEQVRRLCILVDVIGSSSSSRSWESIVQLFEVISFASEKGLCLLEQTSLAALERLVESQTDLKKDQKEKVCANLLQAIRSASNPAASMSAVRIFEKAQPTHSSFEQAFKQIEDGRSFERLAEALCKSSASRRSIERDSSLVRAFCETVFRIQPHNRVALLRAFAGCCEQPGDVVSHWMKLASSETDSSAIAGQFDAQVQTNLLVQLVEEGERTGLSFVAKHLASRTYMKALVEKEDTDISQFIQLFEGLLRKLLESEDAEDEDEKRLIGVIEKSLDALSVLLSVPVFIPVVTEILMRQERRLRMVALRVLKSKVTDEHLEWTKEETKFVLEFVETLTSWMDTPSEVKPTTVLCLNALAQSLSQNNRDVFAKALPNLSKLVSLKPSSSKEEDAEEEEEGAVATAACLCIGTICRNVGTHSLSHLQALVPGLVRATREGDNALFRQAAIAALKDIIESRVALGSLLNQVVSVALTQKEAEDLLEAIGKNIEPRLGYVACLEAFKNDMNAIRIMALLDLFIGRTSAADAVVHLKDLKELSVESLVRVKDIRMFDASPIVKIGLLFSEKRLKEVVDDLLSAVEENMAPAAVLMEVFRSFLEKCGTLFLPILPFDFLLSTVKQTVEDALEEDNSEKKSKKKKQKKSETSSLVLLETCLRCVAECLVHAMSSAYVDADKFESILPVLVSSLETGPVEFTSKFVEPCFATLALSCLSSSQANAMLQTLHHAVTRLLRSQSTRTKLNALSCVKTLFERVGSDYLVLMPDTLPYLAELLEDKDEDIRMLAQKLALVLREISGEDISEFLR